jgi:hypothetical protein
VPDQGVARPAFRLSTAELFRLLDVPGRENVWMRVHAGKVLARPPAARSVRLRGYAAQSSDSTVMTLTSSGGSSGSVTQLSHTRTHGLTYYDNIHGRFIPYSPRGILPPNKCRRGGFPFSATSPSSTAADVA